MLLSRKGSNIFSSNFLSNSFSIWKWKSGNERNCVEIDGNKIDGEVIGSNLMKMDGNEMDYDGWEMNGNRMDGDEMEWNRCK